MIFRLTLKKLFSQKLYSLLIISAISLTIAIFITFTQSIDEYKKSLTSVAEDKVLVAGGTQGHLKTIFNALYFKKDFVKTYKIKELDELKDFGTSIPVFNRYTAMGRPIVGISPDYFSLNSLSFSKGSNFIKIGQCILGYSAAKELGLNIGDDIVSDADAAFDVSKSVPVKMKIVGILNKLNKPSDHIIFTSLKTAWTIHGIGHEHSESEEASVALIDLTKDKLENFHFHGDEKDYPVTSTIIFTKDKATKAEMQAMALENKFSLQIINPRETLEQVNESLSGVSKFFYFLFSLVSIAMALVVLVFFFQSSKIRTSEKGTYSSLGIPGSFYYRLLAGEWFIIITVSFSLGIGLSILLHPIMTQKILNILSS